MSDRETSSAVMERELAAIDEALDAGAARHADPLTRELQELALALRADAPEAAEPFAAELRGRVEAGFPPPPSSPRARLRGLRPPPARRLLAPLGATALILLPLVAIVLATSGVLSVSEQDDAGGSGGGGASVAAPEGSDRSAGALESAPDVLPVPPGGGFEPGQRERRIERSVSLELETPVEEMARVADGVTMVTNRYGGFVLSSSVSTGSDGSGGDFELRIPADRLRPALRDLSELATVRSQSQSGRDVTRDVVTARDRLQAARAERRSLLRRLEDADTDEEAEAIRARLDLVAGEINGLRGQLRDLRLRTDYAVVTVSLLADEDGSNGNGGAGASFDDAIGDAGDLLVGFAGVLVRVLALAVPLALLGLLAWLLSGSFRRRRRESALV
jgi:hypothetical protein